MKEQENVYNEELNNGEVVEQSGSLLDFQEIPMLAFDRDIKIFITKAESVRREIEVKGRTEFEQDQVKTRVFKRFYFQVLNDDLTDKSGTIYKVATNQYVGNEIIRQAHLEKSSLFIARFVRAEILIDEKDENGEHTGKKITVSVPNIVYFEAQDLLDSRKAEKVIKGGK